MHIFESIHVVGAFAVAEGIETSDGGFVVASGNGALGGVADAFLMKFNSAGVLQWYREYDGFNAFGAVLEMAGGELIVAGRVYDTYPYQTSLMKTDAMGNVIWSRRFEGPGQAGSAAVLEVPGGFMTAYSTTARVNATGDSILWNLRHVGWGGAGNDVEPATGGMVVVGTGYFNSALSPYNLDVTKLDMNGNIIWNKELGGPGYDMGAEGQETMDGSFIVGGWTRSFANPLTEAYLTKLDPLGNQVWTKTYGETGRDCYGWSVRETNNGDYVVAGSIGTDIMLLRTDSSGTLKWVKTYGEGAARSVRQTSDGGFLMVAREAQRDLVVIKTDSRGNSICHESVSLRETRQNFTEVANTVNWMNAATNSAHVVTVHDSLPVSAPCSPVLAVPRISLRADNQETGRVLLRWSLELPGEVRHWTLEKSSDGRQWEAFARRAAGLPQVVEDTDPGASMVIYRVVMTGIDGRQVYSNSVTVLPGEGQAYLGSVYPNPVRAGENLKLEILAGKSETAQLQLSDAQGRMHFAQEVPLAAGKTLLELPLLAGGVYFLRVSTGGEVFRRKIAVVQ